MEGQRWVGRVEASLAAVKIPCNKLVSGRPYDLTRSHILRMHAAGARFLAVVSARLPLVWPPLRAAVASKHFSDFGEQLRRSLRRARTKTQ